MYVERQGGGEIGKKIRRVTQRRREGMGVNDSPKLIDFTGCDEDRGEVESGARRDRWGFATGEPQR